MNTSLIFKKAHTLVRNIIKDGDNYAVTFAAALKAIYEEFKLMASDSLAGKLLKAGAAIWEGKFGKKRIYIKQKQASTVFNSMVSVDSSASFYLSLDDNQLYSNCRSIVYAINKMPMFKNSNLFVNLV